MKIKKCGLQKIYRQTFYETFSEQNSEENMRKFLDEAYSEEKLKSEIEDKESETFLAVENQKILGVLKINTGNAETESGLENSLEIQRIYVLKEAKGLGIGTAFGLAFGRKIFLPRNSTLTKALENSASMLLF